MNKLFHDKSFITIIIQISIFLSQGGGNFSPLLPAESAASFCSANLTFDQRCQYNTRTPAMVTRCPSEVPLQDVSAGIPWKTNLRTTPRSCRSFVVNRVVMRNRWDRHSNCSDGVMARTRVSTASECGQCDNDNRKLHKHVCITTNQPDNEVYS